MPEQARPVDWTATFITPDWDEDVTKSQPAPHLRREFDVPGDVAAATLHITAIGLYHALVNNGRVSDDVLRPGWTSYRNRLCYQTYDVASLLWSGRNAIGVVLADGWARGHLGFQPKRNRYSDRLALLAQLDVTLADGREVRIVSDTSWRATTGPILASDLYNGETYDARLEKPGWASAGYDESGWQGVRAFDWPAELVPPVGPPVRRIETIDPVSIGRSPSGKTILDFGQNLVGRLGIGGVKGERGTQITLRHAEILEDGELFTRALRFAEATDRYTLRGGDLEQWEPEFTFHGFRYAEIDGWPGEIRPGDVQAIVCHSDMSRSGWFKCSNEDVNKLHENIVWSLRGNFLDIPTDCPQRSERLGWTGDIQVFAPTACFLYDVSGVLKSWLADLAADQFSDGGVPAVIPDVASEDFPASSSGAGWADAAVLVPWALYQHYGDTSILATQFESMRAWVEKMRSFAGEDLIWDNTFQYGDWLDPAAPTDKPYQARADRHLVATAFFAHSTEVLSLAAGVLGNTSQANEYAALAVRIKEAFRERFATDGLASSAAQTEIVLALEFGLLSPGQEPAAVDRLVNLIEREGYRIGTGFLGTPGICKVLSDRGREDVAYRLLLQKECPSWLYPVMNGATTIWERWDAIQPGGSINPGEMLSFNHYAYGAVGAWLYGTVAGLQIVEPGWQRFRVAPRPGGGLDWAEAHHESPHGRIDVRWELHGDRLEVEVGVPRGTAAEVMLPGRETQTLTSGLHKVSS